MCLPTGCCPQMAPGSPGGESCFTLSILQLFQLFLASQL